ncbi:hypothetical protein [Mesorhizobium sp. M0239]|uniref:hypothetical protein n=1 Tax=Mesorhizobium sp. M0239 TaxID=2956924 RepID=UPI00333AB73D
MIPIGIMASQASGGGGSPPELPDGATAFLDFVNGFYYAGGSTQAISALLGGGFNSGAISGSGMRITPSNGNAPKATGDFLADLTAGLAAGCTILFALNCNNSPGGFLAFIADGANYDVADNAIIASVGGYIEDYNELGFGDSVTGSGLHKEAMTLNRDAGGGDYEYAWSKDGGAAVTQTVTYTPFAVDTVLIGHDGVGTGNTLNDVYVQSITLYPAKLPTDLPALT